MWATWQSGQAGAMKSDYITYAILRAPKAKRKSKCQHKR